MIVPNPREETWDEAGYPVSGVRERGSIRGSIPDPLGPLGSHRRADGDVRQLPAAPRPDGESRLITWGSFFAGLVFGTALLAAAAAESGWLYNRLPDRRERPVGVAYRH